MTKNKLQRFADVREFENVFELTDFQENPDEKPRGKWKSEIFENDHPLILELACGKGGYTLELARRNPDKNYVGVDIKGARIWKGAKRALNEGLDNVRFLRIFIDHLYEYFGKDEVDEIWITFPDPYPKHRDRNKRLTSPKFLKIYQQVLKPGAPIHFKTDNGKLFEYTKRVVKSLQCPVQERVEDIYEERPDDELLTIKTFYEKGHLEKGRTIRYIRFMLPNEPIVTN